MSNPTLQQEAELVKRLSSGDEEAFRVLFEWYTPKLLAFVSGMTKSQMQAEELVQDTFLKIWTNRSSLVDVDDFGGYLFIIAHNKVMDHFRRMTTETKVKNAVWKNISESQNSTQELLDASESRRLVTAAIEQLSTQKQTIFQLSRYEGLTHEEIAKKLGLSKSTVKNHLVETLRHIKDFLHRNTDAAILLVIMHFLKK
jgi:RNA polymerase sigma-70 factor (ECF subfamily)